MRWIILLGVFGACHGADPVLANVPRPSPAVVAGAAAAVAGAATLAAPDAAAKNAAEANKPDPQNKPQKPGPTVPADVLDRLDEQQQSPDAGVPTAPEPAPPATLRKKKR